ncbi:a disintegrin and metalloproteinase with thrombospondin motifs 7 [Trichonephila clavipes]|nr:a disintegrin and metalloproteinase with thrombospondin motifs 7 [Trichonephila clavipes]
MLENNLYPIKQFQAFGETSGYVEVIEVPSGARNVRVDEKGEAINYLAVQGEKGEFYLNGRWFIQWSGEYRAAGTTLYYQRDGEKESLHIPGPTKEPLRILLLYQTENPGLVYEYTIPNENATRKPEFHWSYADWTVCSASCGGGVQLSKPKCIEKEAGLVEDKYCDSTTKPVEKSKECNKHQCPAKWWAGPWQHCSASCGQRGIRKRTVICVRSLNRDQQIALLDDDCEAKLRPPDSEPCPHKRPCHGERETWSASQWSDVCGDEPCNFQSRHVYCSQPDGHCKEEEKPTSRRPCANLTCGVWVVGNWSQARFAGDERPARVCNAHSSFFFFSQNSGLYKVVCDIRTLKKKRRDVFPYPATPKRQETWLFVPPPIRRKSKVPCFDLSGAPPTSFFESECGILSNPS